MVVAGRTWPCRRNWAARSAAKALAALVAAGVLVEYRSSLPHGRGRPTRLFLSVDLLGLSGANPLR